MRARAGTVLRAAPIEASALTLYYRHPSSLEHDTGPHPENAGRIRAIEARLEAAGWPGLELREAPRAEIAQIARVHDPSHIEAVQDFAASGGGALDADTVLSPGSWEAALRAAGAACDAAERLLRGEARRAFCGLRPPGHHAERGRAMGFCLFNNVAVAAAHALAACDAERVLVLDWDVHHGNGTEEIFKATSSVLYMSIHESPLYPGTGPARYEGEGRGEGYTINLPVPGGTGEDGFLALMQHVYAPVARSYKPSLLAISAGYDAHRNDPLATCRLESSSYRRMSACVAAVAAELGVPVLIVLEGGYDQPALAESVEETLRGLTEPAFAPEVPLGIAAEHRRRIGLRWGL